MMRYCCADHPLTDLPSLSGGDYGERDAALNQDFSRFLRMQKKQSQCNTLIVDGIQVGTPSTSHGYVPVTGSSLSNHVVQLARENRLPVPTFFWNNVTCFFAGYSSGYMIRLCICKPQIGKRKREHDNIAAALTNPNPSDRFVTW